MKLNKIAGQILEIVLLPAYHLLCWLICNAMSQRNDRDLPEITTCPTWPGPYTSPHESHMGALHPVLEPVCGAGPHL